MMEKIDASGKQRVYEFSYFVDRKLEAFKKAGKDPHDLFDPSSPDYLGKPEVLAGCQKTMAQSMADCYLGRVIIPARGGFDWTVENGKKQLGILPAERISLF